MQRNILWAVYSANHTIKEISSIYCSFEKQPERKEKRCRNSLEYIGNQRLERKYTECQENAILARSVCKQDRCRSLKNSVLRKGLPAYTICLLSSEFYKWLSFLLFKNGINMDKLVLNMVLCFEWTREEMQWLSMKLS